MPLVGSSKAWCAAALLGLGLIRAAAAGPAAVRWNELAGLIVGRQVTIPLGGEGAVRGYVLAVRDDALLLNVSQTSMPDRYPRGQVSLARSAVSELRVLEERGAGGRTIGSVVGALVGLVAGAEMALHATRAEASGVLTFSTTAVACAIGGYFVGRSVDRRTSVVRVADPQHQFR